MLLRSHLFAIVCITLCCCRSRSPCTVVFLHRVFPYRCCQGVSYDPISQVFGDSLLTDDGTPRCCVAYTCRTCRWFSSLFNRVREIVGDTWKLHRKILQAGYVCYHLFCFRSLYVDYELLSLIFVLCVCVSRFTPQQLRNFTGMFQRHADQLCDTLQQQCSTSSQPGVFSLSSLLCVALGPPHTVSCGCARGCIYARSVIALSLSFIEFSFMSLCFDIYFVFPLIP